MIVDLLPGRGYQTAETAVFMIFPGNWHRWTLAVAFIRGSQCPPRMFVLYG